MTVSVNGPDPAITVVGLIEVTAGGVVVVVPMDEEPQQPVRIADATRHKEATRRDIFFMTGNHIPQLEGFAVMYSCSSLQIHLADIGPPAQMFL